MSLISISLIRPRKEIRRAQLEKEHKTREEKWYTAQNPAKFADFNEKKTSDQQNLRFLTPNQQSLGKIHLHKIEKQWTRSKYLKRSGICSLFQKLIPLLPYSLWFLSLHKAVQPPTTAKRTYVNCYFHQRSAILFPFKGPQVFKLCNQRIFKTKFAIERQLKHEMFTIL